MSTAISSSITLYTNNNYNKVSEVSSDWGNRIIQLAKDIAGDTGYKETRSRLIDVFTCFYFKVSL